MNGQINYFHSGSRSLIHPRGIRPVALMVTQTRTLGDEGGGTGGSAGVHCMLALHWVSIANEGTSSAHLTVRDESSDITVSGGVVDPSIIETITSSEFNNTIVSITGEDDTAEIVIQLADEIHKSLRANQERCFEE